MISRNGPVFFMAAALAALLASPAFAGGGRLLDSGWIQSASAERIQAEIARGADVNARARDGDTPLHWAAAYNSPAAVEALLEAGADADARDGDGATPLHWAAANDRPAAVHALLAGGADADARNKYGDTPLHWAVSAGNPPAIRALILGGADPDGANSELSTPLHWAAAKGGADGLKAAEILLGAGADPNARDETGDAPLHWASDWDSPEAVSDLIEAGADIHALNGEGLTPCGHMHEQKARKLLRHPVRHALCGGDSPTASASSADSGGCAGWLVRSAEDRLSRIAERTLGDASRWPEIAELNGIALRGGSYRVGDCLKLPPR